MGIDVGVILLLMIVLIIILTFITVVMSLRLSRLTKKYYLFMRGQDGRSMEQSFVAKFKEIERMSKLVDNHHYDIETLKQEYEWMLSKYGIVKYDAFDDVGGKLSFALAMLDKDDTGFVINAIHSRDNCFVYLKEIVKGESYIMLSEEEVEALRRAVKYTEDKEFIS